MLMHSLAKHLAFRYIMPAMDLPELKSFLDSLKPDELDSFAKECGTTPAYLVQLKGGHRLASSKLAKRMVEKSSGRLRLPAVRPDIWGADQTA